jgi:hypothetical protein
LVVSSVRPDEEEVRILESMGWAADSDASAAAGAEAAGGGGGPGMGLTIEEPDELDPIPEDWEAAARVGCWHDTLQSHFHTLSSSI